MKKSIKNKIIFSNIIVVIASLCIILLLISATSIKNTFNKRLHDVRIIEIKWKMIENDFYLSMNRWLNGKPYEAIKENIIEIDNILEKVYKESQKTILMPAILKKEIKFMMNLWNHSKKDFISPIINNIDDFVLTDVFLNLESDSKLQTMSFDKLNYYSSLNLKSLIYTNYELIGDKEKSKYIMQGVRLFEQIDRFYNSSESYTKKVQNVISLSQDYSNLADIISTIVIILLIIIEIVMGIILSINNGNRISKPIIRAAHKLINFVGESFERRQESRAEDEITQLNNYVDLLISYYDELSKIAKKFSMGDTTSTISPKSNNDVMGNAFLGISSYLYSLTHGANEIINGNYAHIIEERSEMDILAKTYNKLSNSITDLLEQTKEMTRLESEIKAAAKIQSSVLPRIHETLDGYDVAHTSIAAAEVGGDNYDFRTTKNGNWISIGDVSGHGLEAGILALIAHSAFTYGAYFFESEERENPQIDMYEYVNKTLVLLSAVRSGSCSFMTQNYFFERDGIFYCAGAHEIGLLYKKDSRTIVELKELTGTIPFMGIINEVNAINSKFQFSMDHGDVLLLYSDGLIEAKNGKSEQYDVNGLKESFLRNINDDLNIVKDNIIQDLTDYCQDGDLKKYNGCFADDVTILILRRQ